MRTAALSCVVFVLVTGGAPDALSLASGRLDPKLSAVASRLAGRSVTVYCWDERGWRRLTRDFGTREVFGLTRFTPRQIHLSPVPCTTLREIRAVASKRRFPSYDPSIGLIVLAHESMHARGIRTESVAECYGMQRMADAAVLLGVSREFGQNYAIQYWSVAYQSQHQRYFTKRCRNGGPLDLRPRTDVWP